MDDRGNLSEAESTRPVVPELKVEGMTFGIIDEKYWMTYHGMKVVGVKPLQNAIESRMGIPNFQRSHSSVGAWVACLF